MTTGTPAKLTLKMPGVSKQSPEHIMFTACGRGRALMVAMTMSPGTPTKMNSRSLDASPAPSSPGISEGSFSFDEADITTSPSACTCNRDQRNIICRACGHTFFGRVRKPCYAHPNVIHLMDNDNCPQCHAGQLQEFNFGGEKRTQ